MKIYVVTAQYCEDTVICGVAIDENIAKQIAECERVQEGCVPNGVYIECYDTNEYLPLRKNMYPFEVRAYKDGVEAVPTSLCGFQNGRVCKGRVHNGEKCDICDVYAQDEEHAIEIASALF